jgi:hypothetical protein
MIFATRGLALAACLALGASGGAAAATVGNVGAVNPAAHGAPPGQAAKALSLGAPIVDRERVDTTGEGTAQIVFLDRSTLSIGRSSSVTIDRFVYSGDANGGTQAVSAAKGVLRFVGGGVSHQGGASVRTPTATIGVRGGSALLAISEPDCGTLIVDQYGVLTISTSDGARTLSRPGYGVCVGKSGAISDPFRVSCDVVARLLGQLESKRKQTAGAAKPPTEEEANLHLGNRRPPVDLASAAGAPGLDLVNVFSGGQRIVQSRAAAQHQPLLPPAHEPEYTNYTSSSD